MVVVQPVVQAVEEAVLGVAEPVTLLVLVVREIAMVAQGHVIQAVRVALGRALEHAQIAQEAVRGLVPLPVLAVVQVVLVALGHVIQAVRVALGRAQEHVLHVLRALAVLGVAVVLAVQHVLGRVQAIAIRPVRRQIRRRLLPILEQIF